MRAAIVLTSSIAAASLLTLFAVRKSHQEQPARIRERISLGSTLDMDLSLSGDGRSVSFTNEDGEDGLFIASTAGDFHPSRYPVAERWPTHSRLSFDGKRVLFEGPADDVDLSTTALRMYDRETGRERRLVEAKEEEKILHLPAWSPDSSRIAYVRHWRNTEKRRHDLMVLDLESGESQVLYSDWKNDIRSPSWSHDGTRLAFIVPPNVLVVSATGGPTRRITNFPPEWENPPTRSTPDPPEWSPDDSRLALSLIDDECSRVAVVEVASGATHWPDSDCSMRPIWFPSGNRIAFVRVGKFQRTLWAMSVDGSDSRRIGFADGMVYSYGFDAGGSLLLVGQPSNVPRGLWRVDPSGASAPVQLRAMFEPAIPQKWTSQPQRIDVDSSDGLKVPIIVSPRTCGRKRGPAVLYIHPHGDIAVRWYTDFQYFAAMGISLFAPNFRGSTGNGRTFRDQDDLDGKVEDIAAALRLIRARDDVDPDQIFLMLHSSAATLAYTAVARGKLPGLRAIIDWVGVVDFWEKEEMPPDIRSWPPMLWFSAELDRVLTTKRTLEATALKKNGASIRHETFADTSHNCREVAARIQMLSQAASFIESLMGPSCRE